MSESRSSFATWLERVSDQELPRAEYERLWGQIADRVGEVLHEVVRRFGLRGHDASDAIQEVLLRLVRCVGTFQRDKGPACAWVRQIARHLLIDQFRRLANQKAALAEEDIKRILDPILGPSPPEEAMAAERLEAVERRLQAAYPTTYGVYVICFREWLSDEEAARRLDLAVTTIRTEKSEAKKYLCGHLLRKEE